MNDTVEGGRHGGRGRLIDRDVTLYILGRFLWMAANQSNNVAVGWLVYDVTRSAWALGLIGLAAFLPRVFVALLAGVVVDRHDRRLILSVSLAVNAASTLGLLLVVTAPTVTIWYIYALFVVNGVARGFAGPAAQALIPSLVPRTNLSRVLGLATSVSQFATMLGPALGGLLYTLGSWVPFAFAASAFALASLLTFMIRQPTRPAAAGTVRLSDALAGLTFIRNRPVILGAISLDLFAVLLGGTTALLPIIASEILDVGPFGLGILRSMPALGAMMLGLYLAYVPIRRNAGRILFAAILVFGVATLGLGLSTNLFVSMAMLWLIGASDVFSVVIRHTLIQGDTPDHMRGRVAAANSLFLGASNELGQFTSGALAALVGVVPAILIGGTGTIAVTAIWARLFPGLRRRDRLVDG